MYPGVKRLVDIVVSLFALIILWPVLALMALMIKLDSPGPVLFRQQRVGVGKTRFFILKFRTMRIDTPPDCPTHMLFGPEQYITRVGRLLRKSSLDELPQIVNILRGDMSIVGPRPALYNQDDLVRERDKYGANNVRPGLTGWAQINGRDELPISVKANLDGEYVKRMGLFFDLKVMLSTIVCVLTRKGLIEGSTTDLGSPRASGMGRSS